jgi:small subunit ribosomal protein S28e
MAGNKTQKPKEGKAGGSKRFSSDEPVKAVVQKIVGRTGSRGEVTQVECKVMSGRNEGRVMRRNVRGPTRIGDLLTLRETEIEARRIKGITRGAHS